ncbi:MAG: T9SS type A sorting domain-containing protein, partial [Chitinophagales bacterium]
ILLGDALNTVDAIYGIRFSITYDSTMIDKTSVRVRFNDTWMGTPDFSLNMSKNDPEAQIVDAGYVRTNHANIAGDGQIGTLEIVVVDNIAGKIAGDPIVLQITDARGIKLDMTELSIVPQTLVAETGIEDIPAYVSSIYPNPCPDDQFYISLPDQITLSEVFVTDLSGKISKQFSEADVASKHFAVGDLATGTYFIHAVFSAGNAEVQPLVIMH